MITGFQFGLITDLEEGRSDAGFLYTLKLSYELGLHRTLPVIEQLQLFNSSHLI